MVVEKLVFQSCTKQPVGVHRAGELLHLLGMETQDHRWGHFSGKP